jgi:hypothetical protein
MQADYAQQQLGQRFTAVPAAEAVLRILAESSNDCDMLICALKAVYKLASDKREIVVSFSAAASMVAAVEARCSNKEVAMWGLKALTELAAQPCNKLSFTFTRVSLLVVTLMRKYSNEEDVVLWALNAVHILANNDVGNRTKLGAAGACEASIAAMDKHSTRAHVVEHGCCAIYMLALNSDANTTALGSAGAYRVVVDAVAVHCNVAGVVKWALQAHDALAIDSVNKRSMLAQDVVGIIQRVSMLYEDNDDVQQQVKAALAQLQTDGTAAEASQG